LRPHRRRRSRSVDGATVAWNVDAVAVGWRGGGDVVDDDDDEVTSPFAHPHRSSAARPRPMRSTRSRNGPGRGLRLSSDPGRRAATVDDGQKGRFRASKRGRGHASEGSGPTAARAVLARFCVNRARSSRNG